MEYGMLIDYGHCTGCQSCEISCSKEKNLPRGEWGIKVEQIGPHKLGGAWEWDYVPVPSRLCDLCAQRVNQKKVAPCQLHCLSQCIEILPIEQLPDRMIDLGGKKITCFMP